nr:unnamed protein product [Callosobruchus chinensis]
MQWNARSAVSNKQSLKQFLVNEDVDIALISETWFKPNKTYSFVGYNIVRQDRYDGITGTAILIKREYQFVEIDIDQNAINSDISLCAIKLKLPNDNNLTLASLYKSPQIVTTSQDWKNCFDLFSEPCIIGGDFNGHHLCWGSTRNDETGQQLVGAIDESNLIVLNTGQATRMGGPTQQKSVVDITLCSPNIACKLTWQVIADTLGSDHYPIVISMGDTSEMVIKPKSKWNIKFAKWDLYQSISETLFESIPQNFENIENKYSWFINNINVAAEASIPEKKPFKIKARPPPPWWDLECARALNERREALETYKAMGTLENYINCRRILAKTKKIFNRKARNKWKSWISGLNKDTSNKQLWRQAKIIQRINDNSNFNACSDFSWEEDMLHKLAPPYVTNFKNTDITTTNQYNNLLEQRFTLTELDWAIKKSTCTAPGFDQITYSMLDNLPLSAKTFLLTIFNDIWINHESLTSWKKVVIISILKPGMDPNLTTSYRPISLLSCVFKTFERLIKHRLEWYLKKNNMLPHNQYGQKSGFGTMDAVSTLVTDVQLSFTYNNYLGAIFLDIKGAFDSVQLDILRKKLKQMAIPSAIADTIVDLFFERSIFLRDHTNALLGPRTAFIGIPQGAVLSPLLFNIYTADVHNIIQHVSVIQYADDFCLYNQSKKHETCLSFLDPAVRDFTSWSEENGFTIAPSKSSYCVFTRHNTREIDEINIGNLTLPFRKQVPYLGIILDKKLTWKPYVEKIKARCQKGLNFLKTVAKVRWGANQSTCLLFYKSYILSILDYGSLLYGSGSTHLLKQLDVIQNKALRYCIGAMPSTPIVPLQVEAATPPLNLRRQILARKFIVKGIAKHYTNICNIRKLSTLDLISPYWIHKNSPPLCDAFRETSYVLPYLAEYHQEIPPHDFFDYAAWHGTVVPVYSDNMQMNRNLLISVLENYSQYIHAYTDGSKSEEGTGCAVLIPELDIEKKFKLPHIYSIFAAEAYAIYQALELLHAKYSQIVVLTDALSVIKAIRSNLPPISNINPIVGKIKSKLSRLRSGGKSVVIIWTKAHTGIFYNEAVDRAAKQAVFMSNFATQSVSIGDCINAIKMDVRKLWSEYYKAYCQNSTTQYCTIQRNIPPIPWYFNLRIPRKYITMYSRLRFGHGRFPAFLARIGMTDTNLCEECNVPGTIDHLFFECCKYRSQQNLLWNGLLSDGFMPPYNMLHLLALNDGRIQRRIICFLKQSSLVI